VTYPPIERVAILAWPGQRYLFPRAWHAAASVISYSSHSKARRPPTVPPRVFSVAAMNRPFFGRICRHCAPCLVERSPLVPLIVYRNAILLAVFDMQGHPQVRGHWRLPRLMNEVAPEVAQ
jgi:hypothetical protein